MRNRVKLMLSLCLIVILLGCGINRFHNDYSTPKATFLRVSPGYAIVVPDESVQFSAVELDGNGVEVPNNIVYTIRTQSGDAVIEPNGVFRATSVGEYQVEFRSSSQVSKIVPVTVVPNSQEYIAHIIMNFTKAAETQNLQSLKLYLKDEFILADNIYGNGTQTESIENFSQLSANIVSWSIGDMTVEMHEEEAIVTGSGKLETRNRLSDAHEYYSLITCMITFVLDTSAEPAKISEIWFERSAPDSSNPPNVKAIVSAPPDGTILKNRAYLEYSLGIKNLGGDGYYAVFESLGHPFGTSHGYTEPVWISSGEVSKETMESGYGIETDDPNNNQVVLEISIMSGLAPNDLVCTDIQVFRYTIQVEHDNPDWPYEPHFP